jgi:quinol monooxygenase YgiN
MVTVILSHEVANVAEWRVGFDGNEPVRQQAGVKTIGVYQSVDNPKQISIITEFPSAVAVAAFFSDPNLKAQLAKAGVIGAPEAKILNKI